MTIVKRIQAGEYSVSDGRFIIKDGSSWFVLDSEGNLDFGPIPTLASAKEYVSTGSTSLGNHNTGTKYGRKQSKKEFNAYLASEAKNGNYAPAVIWFLVMLAPRVFATILQGK